MQKNQKSPTEGQTGNRVFVCLSVWEFFTSGFRPISRKHILSVFAVWRYKTKEKCLHRSVLLDFRLVCKSIIRGVVETEQASQGPFLSIASA